MDETFESIVMHFFTMEGDVYFETAGCMCKDTFTSIAYAAYVKVHI